VIEDGKFSQWLKNSVEEGDTLQLQGPMGTCVFAAKPEQAMLLAAIGTGLAPVYGVVRQALKSNHAAPINVVIGAKDAAQFYLVDELLALQKQHSNLNVYFVSQHGETKFSQQGDVYDFCKTHFGELKGWSIYLCGAESFVKKLRMQCFMAGAAMNEISADIFLPSAK
jgi:NAD(P)H-flavin reductase